MARRDAGGRGRVAPSLARLGLRLGLAGLIGAGLAGCMGLAAGSYGKQEWVREEFRLAPSRNQFAGGAPDVPYARDEIVGLWGEPDAVERVDACRVLIYRDGTSWAGVGAFVGVAPVPLLVPSGSYKNRFYLREGRAVGVIQEYGGVDRLVGYTCGSNDCAASAGETPPERRRSGAAAVAEWCAAP